MIKRITAQRTSANLLRNNLRMGAPNQQSEARTPAGIVTVAPNFSPIPKQPAIAPVAKHGRHATTRV